MASSRGAYVGVLPKYANDLKIEHSSDLQLRCSFLGFRIQNKNENIRANQGLTILFGRLLIPILILDC